MRRDVLDRLNAAAEPYRGLIGSSRARGELGPREHAAVIAAVRAMEQEIGVSVTEPDLPRKGEPLLEAAVRVLRLEEPAAAAADWDVASELAQGATIRQREAAAELDALSVEWRQRVHEAIERRQPVPEPSEELVGETMRALAVAHLFSAGAATAFSSFVSSPGSREATILAAITPEQWIAVAFYLAAVEMRMATLTDATGQRAPRAGQITGTADRLIKLAKSRNRVAWDAAWAVRETRGSFHRTAQAEAREALGVG